MKLHYYEHKNNKPRIQLMKNTLRCCISCILPCGALDVIRIVHVNGRVEELTGNIRAAEVLKAYPKHVLKKPTTTRSDAVCDTSADEVATTPHRPANVKVPHDAELQRGKIYFLIPAVSPTTGMRNKKETKSRSRSSSPSISSSSPTTTSSSSTARKKRSGSGSGCNKSVSVKGNLVISDQYLSEILSEKASTQREKRRGRVVVWRPHLESISETLSDAAASFTDHHP